MSSLNHVFKATVYLSLVASVAFFIMADAKAQQGRDASLERKIDRLERQLKAVQRKVFDGGDSRFFSEGEQSDIIEQPLGDPQSGNNLLADLEIRVGAIERRLRELTGKIEESGFKVQQMSEEFRRYREDMEFRLAALEKGGGSPRQVEAEGVEMTGAEGIEDGGAAVGGVDGAPAFIPSPAPTTDPKESFDEAFKLMSQGNYPAAEMAFQSFLDEHRQDPLASNAQYWLGRTYLVQKNYPKAAAAFFTGHTDYPDGAKAAHSLLGLATSLDALGQGEEACGALDLLRSSYNDAPADILQRMTAERVRIGCS